MARIALMLWAGTGQQITRISQCFAQGTRTLRWGGFAPLRPYEYSDFGRVWNGWGRRVGARDA
jgi:hypothetical protein